MRPEAIVVETTGAYSTRLCQYFKERGVRVLLVGPNVL
jgi:transposase